MYFSHTSVKLTKDVTKIQVQQSEKYKPGHWSFSRFSLK